MKHFKNNGALIFLLLLSAAIFSGCLSKPAMTEQTFAFSAPALSATNEPAGSRVLAIKTLQVAPPFDGQSLVYRTGDFSYERDPRAEFLGQPAEVLAGPVAELLRGDGYFGAVVKMGSADKPNALIEIDVSELYGDIRKPGSPSAVLAMQVIVMDAKGGLPGKVLLQKNYSRRIPMKSTSPAALMAAWNEALVGIFADLATDFRRQNINL